MNPLDDPVELGRRIRAARGYAGLSEKALAEWMDASVAEVRDWEAGLSLGETREDRQELAQLVREGTRCPRSWLGLGADSALEERVANLEEQVAGLLEERAQRLLG